MVVSGLGDRVVHKSLITDITIIYVAIKLFFQLITDRYGLQI